MTSLQISERCAGLIWNMHQWLELRQLAKREGNTFKVKYAQLWIDDCRARIHRLRALRTS